MFRTYDYLHTEYARTKMIESYERDKAYREKNTGSGVPESKAPGVKKVVSMVGQGGLRPDTQPTTEEE